jgi:hypothetical protein
MALPGDAFGAFVAIGFVMVTLVMGILQLNVSYRFFSCFPLREPQLAGQLLAENASLRERVKMLEEDFGILHARLASIEEVLDEEQLGSDDRTLTTPRGAGLGAI